MTVEEAVRSFSHSVESGRVAQGYVVVGHPRGEAMAFADKIRIDSRCEMG